ncbi:pyruvate carboxylase [Halarsenatibacter silvermanii]|uniref:Pyruvate carboxylase n=1 Tax=Halarsenatibacter silvermanii TaxID=321763 RepID=A0A1G9J6S5_9FIRM|nr:pyruvate carboxylase [Halarsenatibacter silvermanii]SDL33219.1 pyruvate carboxylase [Halarsenatibacter silvermanii]
MSNQINEYEKILVANRGEIAIRVFRACRELGIRSVAIYHDVDKTALFRTKAHESYEIGRNRTPLKAYLAQDEIIELAQKKGVDAIHPGYGFLSENAEFARHCQEAGIDFIGPEPDMLEKYGNKLACKSLAEDLDIPVIPGSDGPVSQEAEIKEFVAEHGYPILIKAAAGGGGRGMRVVRNDDELTKALNEAQKEAGRAFSQEDVFLEKYLPGPRHVEVQILADKHGNVVHLFERDCSIQRRHQKLIEYTPAFSVPQQVRDEMYDDAVRMLSEGGYTSAGTVEFLVGQDGNYYFIEVNPRIQVEHPVTEMVTGVDIVQSQIRIEEGYELSSSRIDIPDQESIQRTGYSIQARVTTEDPRQDFQPDTGRIDLYRTSSGSGIRLDGGNGFTGAEVTPYFDSLIVKVISWGRSFEAAIQKGVRSLEEMEISGVATNRDFLINVLNHDDFAAGKATTGFLEKNPWLKIDCDNFDEKGGMLNYIGDVIVNKSRGEKPNFDEPKIPEHNGEPDSGTRDKLLELGTEEFCDWIKDTDRLLITDTTYRDAHQSLLATRMRTTDMMEIAEATADIGSDLFSLEMWGGATFDVAYRFLHESPWERMEKLREKIPNILFQMLLRGSNAVGYSNYPDNVIRRFVAQAAESGIDLFRIFDALNWWPGIEVALDEVKNQDCLAECTICYTGDILDPERDKFDLEYYLRKARQLEEMGTDIICIKDMSGLLKPYASRKLISALKSEVDVPIHLHTHDTSGNGLAALLQASEAGVDIVDCAFNSMAGLTSQPALNSLVAALEHTDREPKMDYHDLQGISDYWQSVRPIYQDFESDLKSGAAEIYRYEIPGGQYSNLKPQIESMGMGHRFKEFKEKYREVNFLFGDIIKVTPTSKAVSDMAIFMMQNDLSSEDILEKGEELSFPETVVDYMRGLMGQPEGGFPEKLQEVILKDKKPIEGRPGAKLTPEDWDKKREELEEKMEGKPDEKDLISSAIYPQVFDQYLEQIQKYGNLSCLPSDVFFYGLEEGEITEIELEEGRSMIVKYIGSRPTESGDKSLTFEVNGQRREVIVEDRNRSESIQAGVQEIRFAADDEPGEVGASMPGTAGDIKITAGDEVEEGDTLMLLEAMKMETDVSAPVSGEIKNVLVSEGEDVQNKQLLVIIEEA